MSGNTSLAVNPGDDLFKIAAIYYGDPLYWSQIALANGLIDPLIQEGTTLTLPTANAVRANDGVLTPQ